MKKISLLTIALFFLFLAIDLNAAALYWDLNNAAAGSGGATPAGIWDGTSLNWNSNSGGTSSTQTWPGNRSAFFSAGSDATGSYTITIDGVKSANDVWVKDGTVTFNGTNGGQINFSGGGAYLSNYVAAGHTAIFNVPFGGLSAPDKWGTGTAVYNSASTVADPGYFTLNQGTIAIGNDRAFSSVELDLGDSLGANTVTLCSADAASHLITNSLYFVGSKIIFDVGLGGIGGDLEFTSPIDLGSSLYPAKTLTVNGNCKFAGRLSGTAGITKEGSGTLRLWGTTNTYGSSGSTNGYTTVNSGTLELKKTSGSAIANGRIILNNSGVLQLADNSQIASTVPMTLNGGIISVNSGTSNQFGALTVGGSSLVILGSSGSILKFANSSALAWTAAKTLTFLNWNGNMDGGGTDQIIFGNTNSALTVAQRLQIKFSNPAGLPFGFYDAQILANGELVPYIPVVTPTISINVTGSSALLTWTAGYTLQATTNLNEPFSDILGVTSPCSVGLTPGVNMFFRTRQ